MPKDEIRMKIVLIYSHTKALLEILQNFAKSRNILDLP